MGALSEHHRCPRGTVFRLFDAIFSVSIGCVVGGLLCFQFVDRPVPALVVATAALGGVLANALRQATGGGR